MSSTPPAPQSTLNSDFLLYVIGRAVMVLAVEMQAVAVGWQVYSLTQRPLDLGLVGLLQFLPGLLLFPVTGQTADIFDRRKLIALCYAGFAVCSGLLLWISFYEQRSITAIYLTLVLLGIVRAFNGPVSQALLPQLVSEAEFPRAMALGASTREIATITGPIAGGLLYTFTNGAHTVYAAAMVTAVLATFSMFRIRQRWPKRERQPVTLQTLLAGFQFIWHNKLVLGAISLDLFAVLLGGAVALLPVVAKEILQIGPWGLGILRSAPGIGAGTMALFLAYRPIRERAGYIMFAAVAAFGVMTISFGLSRSLMVSTACLLLLGAADMISVIIRSTLIQLGTPDEMRGRVNAVNMLFIGASNELGQFESGVTAQWFGTVPAVILGGVGTLLVVAIWMWRFPELRRANRLTMSEAG